MAELELEDFDPRAIDAVPCTSCNEPIRWVRMKSGTPMPINIYPVIFVPDGTGTLALVTTSGRMYSKARPALPTDEGNRLRGYESHFATCPNAKDHRKR